MAPPFFVDPEVLRRAADEERQRVQNSTPSVYEVQLGYAVEATPQMQSQRVCHEAGQTLARKQERLNAMTLDHVEFLESRAEKFVALDDEHGQRIMGTLEKLPGQRAKSARGANASDRV